MAITTTLIPGEPPGPPTVRSTGSEHSTISRDDPRLAWFGLDAATLRKAVNRFSPGLGDLIDHVDAAGSGQKVDSHLWILPDDTHTTPAGVHVQASDQDTRLTVEREATISSRVPVYNGLDHPDVFEESVSLSRTDSVGSEWSRSDTVGGSATVEVSVGVEGVGGGKASATASWATTHGESHTEQRTVGADLTSTVKAHLEAGERAVAGLTAWLETVEATIPVRATISGWITLWLKPRHWWVLLRPDGHGGGTREHVTRCSLRVADIVSAWNFPPGGIHMRAETEDALLVRASEAIDAEAELLKVPDDTEASLHAAVVASLEARAANVEVYAGAATATDDTRRVTTGDTTRFFHRADGDLLATVAPTLRQRADELNTRLADLSRDVAAIAPADEAERRLIDGSAGVLAAARITLRHAESHIAGLARLRGVPV